MKTSLQALIYILILSFAQAAYSSEWSLDWSLSHSKETKKLPLIQRDSNVDSGIYRILANDLEFRIRVYGLKNSGPNIVMLHGFPASSIMWDELALRAADSGYRVIAYDQRGYSPGARPKGKNHYVINHYLNDLILITQSLGFNHFHLVGHDVGCVVAWGAAMAFPKLLESMSCLSIPNPEVLELRNYVKLLSIPSIPEAALRFNYSTRFRRMLPKGRSIEEDQEYRKIFTEPGSLTATLNFYRGIYRSKSLLKDRLSREIETPTLFLYGTNEAWVNNQTLELQKQRMADPDLLKVIEIENTGLTGHFLIEMQPKVTQDLILEHIREN